MCTHSRTASPSRCGGDRVVEVARVGRVDGEGGQVAQVHPAVLGRRAGSTASRPRPPAAGTSAAQAAVEHQALEHVAGHVRAPEPPRPRARPRLPVAEQHQVALSGAARPSSRTGVAALEQRLGHLEAPRFGQHRRATQRLARAPGRGAHRVSSRELVERDGQRLVAAGARVVARLAPAASGPCREMVLPLGQVVAAHGQVEHAAVGERLDLLEEALAEGALRPPARRACGRAGRRPRSPRRWRCRRPRAPPRDVLVDRVALGRRTRAWRGAAVGGDDLARPR